VPVNIVWESVGKCPTSSNKICLFGALGDQAYIDFKMDRDNQIVNWKWQLVQEPTAYPTLEELLKENTISLHNDQIRIRQYPSLYEHCSFSGQFVVLGTGWFHYDWLNYWSVIVTDSTSQNGVLSFSSIDTVGCWTVTLWIGTAWEDKMKTFTNSIEDCFQDNLGWLNDKTSSMSSFRSYRCTN